MQQEFWESVKEDFKDIEFNFKQNDKRTPLSSMAAHIGIACIKLLNQASKGDIEFDDKTVKDINMLFNAEWQALKKRFVEVNDARRMEIDK